MAFIPNQAAYYTLLSSGSLNAIYDDIIYWEMAKGTNRFFVTFEKGKYAIPNGMRESIGTMEITFPHVTANSMSLHESASIQPTDARTSVHQRTFMQEQERVGPNNHRNNGFIPITEIKGDRYWQTTITSSLYAVKTYHYEINHLGNTHKATRQVSASYFYPFTQYQLSVLRDIPSVILDMNKLSELPNGIGEKGFALVPESTHPRVKDNLEYYLVKAGLMEKSTEDKLPERPERGEPVDPGGPLGGTFQTNPDIDLETQQPYETD